MLLVEEEKRKMADTKRKINWVEVIERTAWNAEKEEQYWQGKGDEGWEGGMKRDEIETVCAKREKYIGNGGDKGSICDTENKEEKTEAEEEEQ